MSIASALVRVSPDLVAVVDSSGVLRFVSPAAETMLGYEPGELLGVNAFDLVHPVDQIGALEGFTSTLAPGSRALPLLVRLRHADGSWLETEIIGMNHLDDPEIAGMVLNVRDVSASMRTEGALRDSEERYRLIVELAREGICVMDGLGHTTYANRALADLLGTSVNDLLGGSLFDYIGDAGRPEARARLGGIGDEALDDEDLGLVTLDGRLVWARLRSSAVRQHDGTYLGAVVFVTDVTERRELEQRLAEEARRDPLTGVANRKELFEVLSPILAGGALTAALYVDLDGFKEVNDRFGHMLGDELLCSVASRIRAAIRGIDTVARVGGDEFVVICRDLESTEEAVAIGTRVRETLARPFGLAVGAVGIDSSIGIAFGRTADADGLLARADQALYRAKRKGRGRIEITLEEAAA
ncbi:MAG TPA: PAS domain S-box protein [Acidimicrobiia bacterium]|nr:PAS domain S-box protein [Acidimicrobiia bacterium]